MNSGLILAADEEAEMAGVMAHEIAHVAACHYGREMTRANLTQLASLPAIFMGGAIGYGIYQGLGLAVPLTFLHFSRAFESEADYLGIEYMHRAGYDPSGFVSFFEKIQAMEKKKPGTLPRLSIPTRRRRTGSRNRRPRFARSFPPRRNMLSRLPNLTT